MSSNPTLLTLLKQGCRVTFPSGYEFRGETDTGYIQLVAGSGGSDGLRNLSPTGLKEAMGDKRDWEKENQNQE